MEIELSEMNIIYILNSLNHFLRCMEYHYQIVDLKLEMKKYINYENYSFDYENIRLLHRLLSTKGNREIYNIENDIFFMGQKNYLCSENKDFNFLKNKKSNVKKFNDFVICLETKDNSKKIIKL